MVKPVAMPESFKTTLISYIETPGLTPLDRAHLREWSDDDRADEVWQAIDRAVQKHGLLLPPVDFVREMLAIRRAAEAIASRQKYRSRYRKYADKMEELAKFLRKPHPAGMPPTLPGSEKLARMLDDAAGVFRKEVAPSRDVSGVVKIGRQSEATAIFISQASNYLKDITGRWMDDQVAVLTEMAFTKIGDVGTEHVKWLRRNIKRRVGVSKLSH